MVIFLMPRPPGLPAGFLDSSGFLAPSAGLAAGRGFCAAAVLAPTGPKAAPWDNVLPVSCDVGATCCMQAQRTVRVERHLLLGRLRCRTRWELRQQSWCQAGQHATPHWMMVWQLLCHSCQPPPAYNTRTRVPSCQLCWLRRYRLTPSLPQGLVFVEVRSE